MRYPIRGKLRAPRSAGTFSYDGNDWVVLGGGYFRTRYPDTMYDTLAWWLAFGLDWGPQGVFWSIPIAESLFAVAAVVMVKRGRWKTVQV